MPRESKQKEMERWLRQGNCFIYEIQFPKFNMQIGVVAHSQPEALEHLRTQHPEPAVINFQGIINHIQVCQPEAKTN